VAVLEKFSIKVDTTSGWVQLLWSNIGERVDVLACRSTYYTTNATLWEVVAKNVQSPWSDAQAANYTGVYYRLVAGGVTSAYDVGKYTVLIQQSNGSQERENWVSSPFDFMDDEGRVIASKSFDELGVERVVTDESGLPQRRDIVRSQSMIGGTVISASRLNGYWQTPVPAATNWYRNKMYNVAIRKVHQGPARPLTLYGRVSTNDPALVGRIVQGTGVNRSENWVAAWYPWVMSLDTAGLPSVVTDRTKPKQRDGVYSQRGVGGELTGATRGNGVWYAVWPESTNIYPGSGYSIIINKVNTGAERDWKVPRALP